MQGPICIPDIGGLVDVPPDRNSRSTPLPHRVHAASRVVMLLLLLQPAAPAP